MQSSYRGCTVDVRAGLADGDYVYIEDLTGKGYQQMLCTVVCRLETRCRAWRQNEEN